MASPRTLPAGVQTDYQQAVFEESVFVRVEFPAPTGTQRFTDHPGGLTANIDGLGSATWTEAYLKVGDVSQSTRNARNVGWVEFGNSDGQWGTWSDNPGIKGVKFEVWRATFNKTTRALTGAYWVYTGEGDEQLIDLIARVTLKYPKSTSWGKQTMAPVIGPLCPYVAGDPFTCASAAAAAAGCPKTRTACSGFANLARFGGNDLISPPGTTIGTVRRY